MPLNLGRFGLVSGANDVTKGALATLQAWLPSAVVAANTAGYAQASGGLAAPMVYARIPVDVIAQTTDQVPCVYASSTGTVGKPIRVGQATSWGSWYNLNIAVVDRDDTWESTADRIQVWAALIRQVLLSIPNLLGSVEDTQFVSETFGPIPSDEGRTYAGTVVTFQCYLPNITVPGDIGPMTAQPGPIDPNTGLTPALGPQPTITSHQEVYSNGPAS